MSDRIIYKYPLQLIPNVEQLVHLPVNAKILKVALQDLDLYFWTEHTVECTKRKARKFVIRFTGHQFNHDVAFGFIDVSYLDTIIHPGGLVYHVYEVLE